MPDSVCFLPYSLSIGSGFPCVSVSENFLWAQKKAPERFKPLRRSGMSEGRHSAEGLLIQPFAQ